MTDVTEYLRARAEKERIALEKAQMLAAVAARQDVNAMNNTLLGEYLAARQLAADEAAQRVRDENTDPETETED